MSSSRKTTGSTGGLAAAVLLAGRIADVVGDTVSRRPEQIEDLQTLHAGRVDGHNWFTGVTG